MISKDLFERFIRKATNPEETAEVIEYLRANPEALDQLISDEEFDHFRYGERLRPEVAEDMLTSVRKATYEKYRIFRRIGAWSAAAVAILLIGYGWVRSVKDAGGRTAHQVAPLALEDRPVRQHKVNNTGTIISLVLKDGSKVELYPYSGISYTEPFPRERRDIYLEGTAIFEAAQDKSRPFTVYSGGIVTTALGTRFQVSGDSARPYTWVKLIEGRIVVRSVNPGEGRPEIEKFLYPGNELVFDKRKGIANVFVRSGNDPGRPAKLHNHSLAQVFDQLESIYGVHIRYNSEEMSRQYFFGELNTSDPIDTVINEIAILHELSVQRQGKTYILKKIQP